MISRHYMIIVRSLGIEKEIDIMVSDCSDANYYGIDDFVVGTFSPNIVNTLPRYFST